MTVLTPSAKDLQAVAAPFDVEAIRADFPILSEKIHGKQLVYLDNGASAQKPNLVLETIQRANEDVAQTVARMREFYRPREAELVLAPVNLNEVAQDVIDLTRARWSDMSQERGVVIELDTSLAANDPVVPGVEAELRRCRPSPSPCAAAPPRPTSIARSRSTPRRRKSS